MPSLLNTAKAALVFLSAAGYYATWYSIFHNGTTDHMARMRDVGPRLLPGTKEPVRTIYTGIPVVDYQLTILTLFFWELVDGSQPAASLFCFYFATQVACGWGLLVMEGLRGGNRWSLISFIGVWGVLVQSAAYAVVMPIWCIAHLSLSRTVDSRRLADFLINVPDLAGIAFAMVNVYVLLTFLMSLPAPSVINYDLKQCLVAFWQFFPVWVSLVQGAVSYLLPTRLGEERERSSAHPGAIMVRWMRPLYAGLLTAAGIGQAKTLTLMWTSRFLPGLFASEFVGVFDFTNIFVPAATSPFTQMPSIGAGTFLLLQYDYFIGSASMVMWSTVLFINTYRKGTTERSVALLVAGGLVMLALTGPLGYVTTMIWARDELIVAEAEDDDKKKVQ